ncbi:cytochrome c biogenesis protein CcsA [Deinococcus roseus]|uniref:Heme exporter protein C n=1 Tax=Deinococcus roseus TaxID=392414 RepID=A0ABQ2CYY2_9DEIO|nr:cytochrome c biogenesis protein CcsA [Deinococcus roseus]GGJ34271.1 cytochrome c-type biogenesis heme exporter protein C [Deinococcus roseus]
MKDKITLGLGLLTLLGVAAGLYFALTSPPDANQKDLVRIMYLHVPSAWTSYIAYFGTMVFSLVYLVGKNRKFDRLAYSSAELGVLMTILTLFGGSLWARPTWGTYWVWEPRLTTTAIGLLIYIGYFIVRGLIEDPHRRARVAAVIGIAGTLYIPVNYMSVYWWRSIHQTPTIQLLGKTHIAADPTMILALSIMTVAFTVMYLYLLRVRATVAARVEAREDRLLEAELQERRA